LVNEIAPRVHNSGHWTIDGALTSQFEQHIRAIAGWPLGATSRHGGEAGGQVEMQNLVGEDILGWAKILSEPNASLHLYGKAEARPGRKMGHVTRIISGQEQ
jgi:5-(carboxyamino)imidazole ribonucleotide synthase